MDRNDQEGSCHDQTSDDWIGREGGGRPHQGEKPACDDHKLPDAQSPGERTGDERARDAADAATCQDEAGRKPGCMVLLGKDKHDQYIPAATEAKST